MRLATRFPQTIKTGVLFPLLAFGVLWLAAADSRATTQRTLTVEELARASDVIVIGRVIETRTFEPGPGGRRGIHTRVTLAAEEFLTGSSVSLVTLWVQGGRIGNRARVVHGQARFTVGEEVLLFLFDAGGGAMFPTGMGQGKWLHDSGELVPAAGGTAALDDVRDVVRR